MTIGEAFLSSLLQLIFQKLFSIELRELASHWEIENEAENLRMMIPRIQAVLNDAEEKQIKNVAVKMWLDDLKHVSYDLENVLDEIEIEALRKKVVEEEESPTIVNTNQQQVWNKRLPVSKNDFSFGFGISFKIKPITERLEKIAKYMDVLGLREDGVGGILGGFIIQRSPTSSFVNKSRVYGRDKDKEKIIDLLLLLSPSNESKQIPSVIPIVGMGGLGKTTLAQLVYNDDRVVNHFDVKAWVYVSDKFDVLRLTAEILEAVSGSSFNFKQLDPFQVKLKEKLSGEKFLIVLDDVWHENYNDWDLLLAPFTVGAPGSKLIVTTRSERVSSRMGTTIQASHCLKGLSNEDCRSLFAQQAFANRNPNAHPNLVVIGQKIVEKCQGLPLAVKTLGSLLQSKLNDDEWENILNNKIWNLQCDIIPSLKLSYHHLPSHLKRCFTYFSIFPKDHEFGREELVRLWVAEGFVHQKGDIDLMENLAREYFDELCSRSFFEQSNHDDSLFIMHDLVNDLAVSIAGELCFRFEGNKPCTISEKSLHSSYICDGEDDSVEQIEASYEAKSLRTFLHFGSYNLPKQFQQDLFSKFSNLRVLCFRDDSIKELPASIRNLKHLRYIDLSYTQIEGLPESICTLYNLQTLLLFDCKYLSELPKDLANLINLRHLDTSGCCQLQKIPPGIGRLTSLQTLPNFVVGENTAPGSGIEDLRDMLHLRGSLCISNLKNVVNVQDVMEANLKDKHLSCLKLHWGSFDDSRDEKIEEDIFDRLQPNPSDLKELFVNSYNGSRFPSWIGDPSFFKLTYVSLENCSKCRSLPSLGQLPVLKELYIQGNDGVKNMGRELYGDGLFGKKFCSLETLTLLGFSKWEEWSTTAEEGEEEFPRLRELNILCCNKLRKFQHRFPALVELMISNCKELISLPKYPSSHENLELDEGGEEFPCLRKLEIVDCPRLRELPHLLPCLVELEISDCHELTALPRLPLIKKLELQKCDKMSLRRVSVLSSLSYMFIQSLPNLDCLPEGSLQQLQELSIFGCEKLESLPKGLQNFMSLQKFEIKECPALVSFPEMDSFPPSLQHLEIVNCKNLQSLPEQLMQNKSLEYLRVEDCSCLKSFPSEGLVGFPTSLKHITIIDCEILESLPQGVHNFMSLQKFEIKECPSLVSFPEMDSFPPSLQHLEIVNCKNLQSLPEQLTQNKSLEYLRVEDCSCLKSFPSQGLVGFPTSLKHITIIDCEILESLPQVVHNLKYLQSLRIERCPCLMPFPEGGFPTELQTLEITECKNLEPLPSWKLHSLNSLKELRIGGYPNLVFFPKGLIPSTLTYLCITKCQNLKSLPQGFHNLISLQRLEIWKCEKLESLPKEGLPAMLRHLYIVDCPLLAKRCQKEKGKDWSKISNRPTLSLWII